MAARTITQEEVIARRDSLPAFPRVIEEILVTLDDPEANLNMLVEHIGRDPVMVARVFSQANAVATRRQSDATVRDLYTATSLIGLSRLRYTAIATSLAGFLRGALPPGLSPGFWEHSAAASVCAEQLAAYVRVSSETAMIAGLLHDVGQLWLYRFEPDLSIAALQDSVMRSATIVAAERKRFGVDHAVIGGWLAESWGLPQPVCDAIRCHHAPDAALPDAMVAVVHVAEVLSNALDVSGGDARRVTYLSAKACEELGLNWDESANALFGRIDAVSRFVGTYFKPVP